MDLQITLNQCRHGDPEAFEQLFDYFEHHVYDLACVILRDPHDAQDAVQETFIRVLERLDSYRGEAAFQTWLTAIAVNCCRDMLRRRQASRWLPLVALNHKRWRRRRGQHNDPAYRMEQNLEKDALWQAVNTLDDRLRSPFILFYRYEMKCEEIAAVLGLATTTIYDQLSQARRRLRLILAEEPAVAPVIRTATEHKRC
ncbi:MAG: sigma-70 family RNA polymerase sigma factor [Chloroflexota bacterium]